MAANINFNKSVVGTPVLNSAGDTVTYSFSIENEGPDTIDDLQLTDTILDGVVSLDLLDAVAAGTVVLAGDDGDNILEVGETWTFTEAAGSDIFTYAITQADLDSNGTAEPNPVGAPDLPGQIDNEAVIVARNAGQIVAGATEGAAAGLIVTPDIAIDKEFVNVTGGDGDALADAVGDVLNYTVAVTNTGNVTLTGVTVVDPLTGQNISGVTLAPGATQTFNSAYVLTQADLDGAGNAGSDIDIDNTATADSNETPPVDDSEEVPLDQQPGLAIDKEFVNVTGGDGDALADAVGDVLNYTVAVTNTGNVTLTGVTVVDPLTGQNISGVTLAPGATQTFNSAYVLTQADLDGAGNAGSDIDIDNTATADSNETPPVDDSEEVPLDQQPGLAVDKVVQDVDGVVGGSVDEAGDIITYDLTVTNTGNVTLTNVTVVDPLTGTNVNVGTLAVGASTTVQDQTYTVLASDITNNGGGDGDIDNTTTADSDQTGPVTDSAAVPIILPPNEEPGVRTPGFWQNPNNGGQFWDGIPGNEDHAGEPGFPEGELLYQVDSDCDDVLDNTAGLLIGDYNQNGLTDANEDTLFISLADAQALVGSGGGSDGVEKVGRDVVATWLNFLAGNDIDNPGTGDDLVNPQHFIDDAIDWLQVYGDASALSINNPLEDCDVYSPDHAAVRSNSAAWNTATFLDHSAAEIHAALDQYNNTGNIGLINYAPDADLLV